MISLLTMGAGNVKVLKKTIESFIGICDEVIYGDMLLFEEDREILKSYQKEFNIKIVELPFNYIQQNGFSSILNLLSGNASNDLCIYMNTSEVINVDYGMVEKIINNTDCNSFYFTHATERHRWYRCYNRQELRWDGLIHEELTGHYKPFHKPIFEMADLEKDMDDDFKSKLFNDAKEIVYWTQLCRIVDDNSLLGATSSGWLQFAYSQYESMKERLNKKGERYIAYINGDLQGYINGAINSNEFAGLEFKSSDLIAYQGDKIHLL